MSYEEAERILAKQKIGTTAFRRFKTAVLKDLCVGLNLDVGEQGKMLRKQAYIEALLEFVSTSIND
jgi:hypothetical protein